MAFEWMSKLNFKYMLDKIKTYIDNALSTVNSNLANKASRSEAIKNITRNGTTFTATRTDDTTFTFTQQDNNDTYPKAVKNITRNGTTFTATCYDGTTFTFTQQDNNTWRGCQNNLTSTATDQSLSAYQGKVLNDNKVGSADYSGSYYKVKTLYTFVGSDNCLIQGTKGNYVWGIASWSDKRLKTNIKDSSVNALERINKIKMREFDFINDTRPHQDIGYIAQELINIFPEAVVSVPIDSDTEEGVFASEYYQVEDKHLIKYLVKAIQELSQTIIIQQKQIDDMQKQIDELKDMIKQEVN